jgi:hypothetical protein
MAKGFSLGLMRKMCMLWLPDIETLLNVVMAFENSGIIFKDNSSFLAHLKKTLSKK